MGIKILSRRREKPARVLKTVLTCFIAIGLTTTAITEFFIIRAAVAEPAAADYAIVLGAGVNGDVPSRSLKARLEAALDYAEKYPDAVLILSGGQGSGENITEARCMYNWLTDSGLSGERLILEENASNTAENIQFSRNEILTRDPDFDGTVCIITEGYHVLRAQLTAQKQGLQNLTAAPAYTGLPILTVNYYLRETPAVWYYLLK
jgi:uncharacterized SAM-binding protein YcdF (DUF218 family)